MQKKNTHKIKGRGEAGKKAVALSYNELYMIRVATNDAN